MPKLKVTKPAGESWYAYAFATGEIHYGPSCPAGALVVSRSPSKALRAEWQTEIERQASLSTCGAFHRVPGISGENQLTDVDALHDFAERLMHIFIKRGWK